MKRPRSPPRVMKAIGRSLRLRRENRIEKAPVITIDQGGLTS